MARDDLCRHGSFPWHHRRINRQRRSPHLSHQLNTNFQIIQWVVLAYMLTQAILLVIMGRLADIHGKKRIYQAGMLIFTLSSALCGIAPSVEFLIFSRIIQAIGAAMTAGLGMAIVTENFPNEERGRALGIMGTIVTIGIVFGPAIGGLILSSFSWRWIFFVNLPIGLFGYFMVRANVPHSSNPSEQKFDFLGATLLLVTLLSLLIGLTLGQTRGFGNLPVLSLIALSLIGLFAFIITEQKVTSPMIDLSLFTNKLFSPSISSLAPLFSWGSPQFPSSCPSISRTSYISIPAQLVSSWHPISSFSAFSPP